MNAPAGESPTRRAGTAVPILLYHAVTDRPSEFIAPYTVSPATFRRHLDAVAATGATTLTVSGFLAARTSGTLPERPVLVTFDDGYRDTLTTAAPALAERGMTATVYVTTGVVDAASPGGDPMLTWSQIDELAGMGHEIGAHSHTHPQLDTLALRSVRREVGGSRAWLQDRTGLPIASFAYPHGYSDARVRRVVRDAGFTSACSVKNALSPPNDRPYTLARLMVMSGTTDAELDGWLAGRGVPVGQADERLLTVGWRWYRRARGRVSATAGAASGWSDAA
jgi:peptidoglycan/xylan/chitin deacetylase (PgdA/CDA1 family)